MMDGAAEMSLAIPLCSLIEDGIFCSDFGFGYDVYSGIPQRSCHSLCLLQEVGSYRTAGVCGYIRDGAGVCHVLPDKDVLRFG